MGYDHRNGKQIILYLPEMAANSQCDKSVMLPTWVFFCQETDDHASMSATYYVTRILENDNVFTWEDPMRKLSLWMLTLLLVAGGLLSIGAQAAQGSTNKNGKPPILSPDQLQTLKSVQPTPFTTTDDITGGFGDADRSYAWSLGVYNGDLYVGTGQYTDTFQVFWQQAWALMGSTTGAPTLPDTPDVPLPPEWTNGTSITDLAGFERWRDASIAEIWRFNKRTGWTQVFVSPMVDSKFYDSSSGGAYQVPSVMGFRSMSTLTDKKGKSAIFAFVGVGGSTFFANPNDIPLIYRSTGGNWEPVDTPSGMGVQTRASATFDNKLFVGVTNPTTHRGEVWYTETANPQENDWKFLANFPGKNSSDRNTGISAIGSFNKKLYVATENFAGFQVFCGTPPKSPKGRPTGPWTWERIVDYGGGDHYSFWASTMKEFNGSLYIGSIGWPRPNSSGGIDIKGFDLLRIDARNKPHLAIGGGGLPISTAPGYEKLRSESGWPSGFGNPLNLYAWSLEVYNGKLYLGTFDASIFLRYLKDYSGPLPIPELEPYKDILPYLATGADLWQTSDGVHWLPLAINGLGNQNNYGLRNMITYKNSLAIGTSNPFQGCEVHFLTTR